MRDWRCGGLGARRARGFFDAGAERVDAVDGYLYCSSALRLVGAWRPAKRDTVEHVGEVARGRECDLEFGAHSPRNA